MIIHYIVEKKFFAVIGCKLLEQQKNGNVILKIALKLMVNKLLRCPRRENTLNSKILEEK